MPFFLLQMDGDRKGEGKAFPSLQLRWVFRYPFCGRSPPRNAPADLLIVVLNLTRHLFFIQIMYISH